MDREPQRLDWTWIGACIRDARVRQGWSQTELGAQVGLKQRTISHIERGEGSGYPLRTYWALSQVLGLSWTTLVQGTGTRSSDGHPPWDAPSPPPRHDPQAVLVSLASAFLLW